MTAGRGSAGVASLVADFENGGKVTYSWATDVLTPRSGLEFRTSLLQVPRESYAFSAYLSDANIAVLQSALVVNAAIASVFLVGLTHEALQISAASTGTTINVWSTAYADFCYAGCRVLIVGPDDATIVNAVVQSFTSTTIVVDTAAGSAGGVGGRIMPAMSCYLDDSQGLALEPVNVGRWDVKARATLFGNATSAWAPVGATVTTYDSIPVFDRGLVSDDVVARIAVGGTELIDRGGVLADVGVRGAVNWTRQVKFVAGHDYDRQWLKAFVGLCAGKWQTFLLPTWRPDLVLTANPSGGTITVYGPPTAGAGDYAGQWWNSLAHRRLQFLISDGTVQYRDVASAVNNGNGTQTLSLNTGLTATVAMVSFLETARLDSDDVEIQYQAAGCSAELAVRVVQQ